MNALEDEVWLGRVCRVERCARLREFSAHGTAPGSQNVWKHIETACRFESKAPPEAESEQVGSEFHFSVLACQAGGKGFGFPKVSQLQNKTWPVKPEKRVGCFGSKAQVPFATRATNQ